MRSRAISEHCPRNTPCLHERLVIVMSVYYKSCGLSVPRLRGFVVGHAGTVETSESMSFTGPTFGRADVVACTKLFL